MLNSYRRVIRHVARCSSIAFVVLAMVGIAAHSQADTLARETPESVGLSSERLQRLSGAMQGLIDDGRLAGITTMIAGTAASCISERLVIRTSALMWRWPKTPFSVSIR